MMAQSIANKMVRVLRKGKLMGEERKFGDLINAEEFYALSPNVQSALLSSNHVEVLQEGTALDDNDRESMGSQQAQLDRLRETVKALEKRVAVLEGIPDEAESDSVDETGGDQETGEEDHGFSRDPKKGDTVSFLGEEDESLSGKVTSVVKKDRVAKVAVEGSRERWTVGFDDLTITAEE